MIVEQLMELSSKSAVKWAKSNPEGTLNCNLTRPGDKQVMRYHLVDQLKIISLQAADTSKLTVSIPRDFLLNSHVFRSVSLTAMRT
jgi:hypothetical protein